MKLHQTLAINKTTKAKNYKRFSDLHKLTQKSDLFKGLRKRFKPISESDDDDDVKKEELKAENPDVDKNVAYTVSAIIDEAISEISEMWSLEYTKDLGNMSAKADIILYEDTETPHTLLTEVPVTFLIYFEKQLDDIAKFIKELPVLSNDKTWKFQDDGKYASETEFVPKTKKVDVVIKLSEGTDKHAPQSTLVQRDRTVGKWETTYLSGEISASEKKFFEDRLGVLTKAVKSARERANAETEVTLSKAGSTLAAFIFNK